MAEFQNPNWPDAAIVLASGVRFQPCQQIFQPVVQSRMFLWCSAGSGSVEIGEITYPISTGSTLLVPWGTSRNYIADHQNPYHLWGIHLVPNHSIHEPVSRGAAHGARDPLLNHPSRRDAPGLIEIVMRHTTPQDPFILFCNYLLATFHHQNPFEPWARDSAKLFLPELIKFLNRRSNATESKELADMMSFLRKRLPEKTTLDQLCRKFKRSPSTVERIFKSELNFGPKEYLNRLNEETAKELLAQTKLPVGAIGKRVGYTDEFYFSKWFKHRTGMPPSQFRLKASTW